MQKIFEEYVESADYKISVFFKELKSENKNIIAEDAMQMLLFEVENVPFPTPEKYDFKFETVLKNFIYC